ncbi:MAG: DNA repair protein RadC [Maritimibacter sp.]|nr:DNA repair protein RadC [Maritimibacter sp.]
MTRRESNFSEAALPLFAAAQAKPVQADVAGEPASAGANRRQRLSAQVRAQGAQAVSDEDLLELLLFRALPDRDATPLARALLNRFGDFNGVISAPAPRLFEQPGVSDTVVSELKIVEAAAQRLARARVIHRNVISSWDALLDYCRTTMAHRDTEHFRVLFLDRQNALIADEEQGRGTVNHVPVYPREVAKRALELNASALILVHNHPSGDPTPSDSDIAMTGKIRAAVEALEITLHDHLVIGRGREVSFRDAGLLRP